MFTKTAKSEVYKNLRKFLEIYKNYTTEVYKNHRKSDVYKNRIFLKFTNLQGWSLQKPCAAIIL